MAYETILYDKDGRIATITLNRPEKFNSIRPPMPEEIEKAIAEANADDEVRVIILQGAGGSFCAGFDFSDNLEHFEGWGLPGAMENWNPGRDFTIVTNPFVGPVPKFMSIWRSIKPVIAKIHGWCVGGGSEMALLADIVIASDDARFGTPYSRVWGCHLTGMWIYRLGLTRAKMFALTGDSVSGREAAEIGLINKSYPLEELDEKVRYWAERIANIPTSQLAAMKLIVNQVYDNMGLATTQYLGPILDGYMRNTPEGKQFVNTAKEKGVAAAIAERDRPFGDYSQGDVSMKPRKL
ncbi:crotonase/enoyl-CoA hydratase family protein [Desulfotruncus alcoholivorax]|uniref:crotonase/enoyl-CoA hydratase family protein n=1 Tax=Desulfotruncus alcoholivorax TaxID=265477 RepID=UPI000412A4E8|nr:crotonase/enoyl-CoA hydratase family protein [Desulfotruncus alcoholivorax]